MLHVVSSYHLPNCLSFHLPNFLFFLVARSYVVSVNWSAEMVKSALAQEGLNVVVAGAPLEWSATGSS